MRATLGFLLCLPLLAGCGSQADQPTQVAFASYEDCILGKLGPGQSTVVSEALIAACRAKFPRSGGLFDDVLDKPARTAPTGNMFDELPDIGSPANLGGGGLFDDILRPTKAKAPNFDDPSLYAPAALDKPAELGGLPDGCRGRIAWTETR